MMTFIFYSCPDVSNKTVASTYNQFLWNAASAPWTDINFFQHHQNLFQIDLGHHTFPWLTLYDQSINHVLSVDVIKSSHKLWTQKQKIIHLFPSLNSTQFYCTMKKIFTWLIAKNNFIQKISTHTYQLKYTYTLVCAYLSKQGVTNRSH